MRQVVVYNGSASLNFFNEFYTSSYSLRRNEPTDHFQKKTGCVNREIHQNSFPFVHLGFFKDTAHVPDVHLPHESVYLLMKVASDDALHLRKVWNKQEFLMPTSTTYIFFSFQTIYLQFCEVWVVGWGKVR